MTDHSFWRIRPWQIATVVSVGVSAVGLLALSTVIPTPSLFVLAVVGFLGVESVVFYRTNAVVRRDSGPQPFTAATLVTVLRGGAVVLLAGFVVVGRPPDEAAWLPALLFGAGALFDAFDGALARATGSISQLGSRLDVETDALVLLVGTAVAVRIGAAPAVFLLVGLARYAFVAGLFLRRLRDRAVGELPDRKSRRLLGAGLMVVVFLVLTPVLDPAVTRPLALGATIPFLLGFYRDWRLITER